MRDAGLKTDGIGEVVLVGGSTRIPYVRRRVGEFFGRTPHTELNPDEVVAMGAAVQADILTGGRRHMLLLDVVPLSLGIETLGGAVGKLIHRNSTIPARATERFTTFVDNQTAVDINIYQGERGTGSRLPQSRAASGSAAFRRCRLNWPRSMSLSSSTPTAC